MADLIFGLAMACLGFGFMGAGWLLQLISRHHVPRYVITTLSKEN